MNKKVESINSYAEDLVQKIKALAMQEIAGTSSVKSAVVISCNSDGTVNIAIPPDISYVFHNIPNQTPFLLNQGDSVEVLLKDNSMSNCWVIAKHGVTFLSTKKVDDTVSSVDKSSSNSKDVVYYMNADEAEALWNSL